MLDYLKIFPDIEVMLKRYTDEERGRLFMAMMAYAYRGEEPDFADDAHEWYIWDTIKLKIDQCAETLESKRTSGKKGGSAKQTEADASESKKTQANASSAKQTEADASESVIYKNKNMNKNKSSSSSSSSYVPPPPCDDLTDDELREIRQEQAETEKAARRVGLPVSALADQDCMDSLRAEHGINNLLKAIDKLQGAPEKSRNWRYVGGILRKEKAAGYTWTEKPPESAPPGGGQMIKHNYTPSDFAKMAVNLDEEE